ncbi:MAG: choice-of-anchor V domain-containing protein [Bacteroidia bacterium]
MKKILIAGTALLAVLTISLSNLNFAMSEPSGADPGCTGSPGDSNKTCAQSNCHSGSASARDGMISSDVPAGGYIPGETYLITVSITQAGISKWGFQASPQNTSGGLLGSISVSESTRTKLVGSNKYITHKTVGTTGSTGSSSWTFNWTAPAAGTGDVTMYAAVMASNNNNSSSGDQIFTDDLLMQEDISSGLKNTIASSATLVYPNPVEGNTLFIKGLASGINYEILDQSGRLVQSGIINSDISQAGIDVSSLLPGIYLIRNLSEPGAVLKFVRK